MNFNYQKACLNLVKDLPERQREIIWRRFGFETGKRETLESIGKSYSICRERVRQIEADGFSKIRPKLKRYQKIFQYFLDLLKTSGGLKKEDILLSQLGKAKFQNQVYFLLTLAEPFERFAEDKDFYSFWLTQKESFNLAQKIIDLILDKFEKEKRSLTEEELFKINSLTKLSPDWKKSWDRGWVFSYLEISKKIFRNSEGQFGLKNWPEINPRGVKDKAYLVFKKEKRPLHFTEVANLIEGALFQTVHNELIKDPRFILIGRGIYGLEEWGYYPGQVKDIILKILKEEGPLTKEEILERVLKQRLVKESTILLNLSNKKYFFRDSQGKYFIKTV